MLTNHSTGCDITTAVSVSSSVEELSWKSSLFTFFKKSTIAGEVIIRGAWLRVVFAHFINENTDYSNGLIVAVLFS
jgi:hypothetical protein